MWSPCGLASWDWRPEELGRPVLRGDPLCSWWGGLVGLTQGSAILWAGGSPRRPIPGQRWSLKGARGSPRDTVLGARPAASLSLRTGRGSRSLLLTPRLPEGSGLVRPDGKTYSRLPPGLHAAPAAFTAPSACLQDENTNQRGQGAGSRPHSTSWAGPHGGTSRNGFPSAPPAPEMKAVPGIPQPQKDPRQALGGLGSPHPGEPRAGALTPGPRASQPMPAELRAQPRAPPAKPPLLAAAGEPFGTANPGPGVGLPSAHVFQVVWSAAPCS